MILELNITPNRGDAMSVIGVAREVAALSGGRVSGPAVATSQPSALRDTFGVNLDAPAGLPEVRRTRRPRRQQ